MSNFTNLDEHQQILDAAEKLLEATTEALESANNAISDLSNHNTDPEAHQDIRALIQNGGGTGSGVTPEEVDAKISIHNTNNLAHADLRVRLDALEENSVTSGDVNTIITEQVETQLGAHNDDSGAHQDIRDEIAKVAADTSRFETALTEGIGEHNVDPESHEDIRALITALSGSVVTVGQVDEKIENHAEDGTAHQDIRDKIDDLSGSMVTSEQTDDKIDDHNTAPDAHQDIRDLIAGITGGSGSTGNIGTQIDEKIAAHNVDSGSHTDIRTKLTELEDRLDESDVGELASTVSGLENVINSEIKPNITNLQSSTEEMSRSIESISGDLTTHLTDPSAHQDIRDMIDQITASGGVTSGQVDAKIAAHNTNSGSHQDLRDKVTALEGLVGETDVGEMSTTLGNLENVINNEIKPNITNLQSSDERLLEDVAELSGSLVTHNTAPDAHQDIRNLIAEMVSSGGDVDIAIETAMAQHNADSGSHLDIRALIASAGEGSGTVSLDQINAQISLHNASGDAHSDIRTLISNLSGSMITANQVDSKIEQHDDSSSAHADIRALISELSGSTVTTGDIDSKISTHNSAGNAHSDIRNLINTVSGNAVTSSQVDSKISTHNSSEDAHQDIRDLINTIGGDSVSAATVSEMISTHNVAFNAHTDIRDMIDEVSGEVAMISTDMNESFTELVTSHNNNSSAHPFLLDQIASLQTQVGSFNIGDTNDRLDNLENTINSEIRSDIDDLQTTVAQNESNIADARRDITELGDTLETVMDNISDRVETVVNSVKNTDADRLMIHNLDREEVFGYTQYEVDGPYLKDAKCSLPTYVRNGATVQFTITGALKASEVASLNEVNPMYNVIPQPLKFSLEKNTGDFTLNPTTNISQGTLVTMTVGSGNKEGDILDFTARFTDPDTDVEVQRVYSTMIATSIAQSSVLIVGLVSTAEPGAVLPFTIANADDDGSGRFTYRLEAGSSGITFNKSEDITLEDSLTATIPSGAERETTLTFQLIAEDSLGTDITVDGNVYINALPSSGGFTHNVPETVVPNQTYSIKFSGVTSVGGRNATYAITDKTGGKFTFSKNSAIVANENVTMTVTSSAVRGTTYNFDVVSTDENDVSFTFNLSSTVNTLPNPSAVTHTLPATSQGGKVLTFQISGGTDVASYKIDAASSGLTFSKTTGILPSTNLTVTLPKVSEDSPKTFKIYVVDSLGEQSATSKDVTITITPIYLSVKPSITYPTNGDTNVPSDGFTMTWTEFQYTVDV